MGFSLRLHTMSMSLPSILRAVQHGVSAFFKADLKLQRADSGVRIVLEEKTAEPKPRPPSRAEKTAQREQQELELMRTQLAQLLGELPTTRDTMKHLVLVEQALAKKGLRALHKVPLDVLRRAHVQLEGLVTNWTPVGLASLRSRMAVAIIDREHLDHDAEADAYRTAAVLDNSPESLPETKEADVADGLSDEDALAAAYAALGASAPAPLEYSVEMHGELESPAARALQRLATRAPTHVPERRTAPAGNDPIRLRELEA